MMEKIANSPLEILNISCISTDYLGSDLTRNGPDRLPLGRSFLG